MAKAFCHAINRLNEWTGKIACWLLIPLTLIVVYEVVLRYVFNRPTIWAWDINVLLLGALVILCGGYVLLHGSHIGVDVLVVRLSPRKRAIVDLITSLFFFFTIGLLLWKTAAAGWLSLQVRETFATFFAPPIYHLKLLMVVGVLFFLLQGVVKFIHDLGAFASREIGGKL